MPVEFSRISVRGFKRLKDVQIELGPLNVLIGPNGVGKSTVLDVFDLIAASAVGDLAASISAAGGMTNLLTNDGSTDSIDFEMDRPVENSEPLKYNLRIASQGQGYLIASEQLSQRTRPDRDAPMLYVTANRGAVKYFDTNPKPGGGKQGLVAPNWDYDPSETALSQVPKMFREPEAFRSLLASSTEIYHSLDVSSRAHIRLPQPLQPAGTPGNDGQDLFSCLYNLREDFKDNYELVIDALKSAFPTFEFLELPLVGSGTVTLRWKDKNFKSGHYPNQLSEGMLRFLWLVTLLQSPGLPKITLIDEPEVSLHPHMLSLLADLMREASSRTQLIVVTHSDRLVRFLEPDEIVTCAINGEGNFVAQRGSDLNIGNWLREYSLDELWTMGRLEPQI